MRAMNKRSRPSSLPAAAKAWLLILCLALASVLNAKSPSNRAPIRLVGLDGIFPADVRTIGLVSMSSSLSKEKFELGTNLLTRAGYRVKAMPNVLRQVPPETRARLFEQAWLDPEIDYLLFSCGGQGASNVVARVDWPRLKQRKMRVQGFSDVTLLLNAMDKQGAGRPIAGPMLSTLTAYCSVESGRWLRQMLDATPPPLPLHPVKPCAAPVCGRPVGGLLSRFPVLRDLGLLPSFAGRIVIFECTPKYAERAEADLDALVACGAFRGAAAVVFADFNRKWEKERTAALFARFAAKVECPVFSGYPFGHVGRSFAFDFTRPLTISPDGVLECKARAAD